VSPVVLGKALRRSLEQVRYVTPVKFGASSGLTRAVYRQVEREFGMLAPPVALHSPAPEVMAASWLLLRETMVASWHASRSAKEVVASTVSVNNACPYCVAVHGATLHGLLRDPTAQAISETRFDDISDPELLAIATWARTGKPPRPTPLPPEQAAELVGVAVTFEYYNRMVNVFLDESPLPSHVPTKMRGTMMRLLSVLMRGPAGQQHAAGESLELLPAAEPSPDVAWAADAPHIASAFARAAATIGTAGERSVPESVRQLVTARLAGWDGEPMGLGRAWLVEAVDGLPPADRAAGRVALLTAFASHQVGQADIDEFRRCGADDQRLIEVAAWAGFAVASSRLVPIMTSYR
jgi:AhpD family alkylhydroperoxidase